MNFLRILCLLCAAITAGAASLTRESATLSLTNFPQTGDEFTVNGSTRIWTNQTTATTIATNLSSIAAAATNLYNAIAAHDLPGPLTVTWQNETSIVFWARVGNPLSITTNNWALIATNSDPAGGATAIRNPISAEPHPQARTNHSSGLVEAINDYATNAFAGLARAMVNFANLTSPQTLSNKTVYGATNILDELSGVIEARGAAGTNKLSATETGEFVLLDHAGNSVSNSSPSDAAILNYISQRKLFPLYNYGATNWWGSHNFFTNAPGNIVFFFGFTGSNVTLYASTLSNAVHIGSAFNSYSNDVTSLQLGYEAHATEVGSVALGQFARALADGAIALGQHAWAADETSAAFGQFRSNGWFNSVSFFGNSTNDNEIRIGDPSHYIHFGGRIVHPVLAGNVAVTNIASLSFQPHTYTALGNGVNVSTLLTNPLEIITGTLTADSSIIGLAAGYPGQISWHYNRTGYTLTYDEDINEPTEANRIITTTGAAVTVADGHWALLIYGHDSRWHLVLTSAASVGGGSGEVNTSSNTGSGVGLANAKSGTNLPFKSLNSGNARLSIATNATDATLTVNTNDLATTNWVTSLGLSNHVDVASTFSGLSDGQVLAWDDTAKVWTNKTSSASGEANTASNIGSGKGIFKRKNGVNLEFKSLTTSGANLAATTNDTELNIAFQIAGDADRVAYSDGANLTTSANFTYNEAASPYLLLNGWGLYDHISLNFAGFPSALMHMAQDGTNDLIYTTKSGGGIAFQVNSNGSAYVDGVLTVNDTNLLLGPWRSPSGASAGYLWQSSADGTGSWRNTNNIATTNWAAAELVAATNAQAGYTRSYSPLRLQTNGTAVGQATNLNVTGSGAVTVTSTNTAGTNHLGITATRVGVYRTIYIDAGAMVSNTTAGATFTTIEGTSPTNRMSDFYSFADGTTNIVQFKLALPREWDLGTVKLKVYWTAASGASSAAVWAIDATAISDDDAMTGTWGTEQTITDTVTANDDLLLSPATSALTIGGTPAAEDLIYFRVRRLTGHASDNLGAAARLLGVWLQYKETSTETASW